MEESSDRDERIYGDIYHINNQSHYQYESDDRQILVQLLHEYSEKLTRVCDNFIDVSNKKILSKIYAFSVAYFPFALITTFSIYIYLQSKASDAQIADKIIEASLRIIFSITFIIMITVFLFGLDSIRHIVLRPKKQNRWSKEKAIEREAANIAIKLDKVIKLTTEIQDKLELNLTRKIELDLRIADAESALDYYYLVFNRDDNKRSR